MAHPFGTRVGEAGAGAFTIMKLMGHSSVTVSQKYAHPMPEAVELAFGRLRQLNKAGMDRSRREVPHSPRELGTMAKCTLYFQ